MHGKENPGIYYNYELERKIKMEAPDYCSSSGRDFDCVVCRKGGERKADARKEVLKEYAKKENEWASAGVKFQPPRFENAEEKMDQTDITDKKNEEEPKKVRFLQQKLWKQYQKRKQIRTRNPTDQVSCDSGVAYDRRI